jgi:hypothetical protein
MVSQTECGLFPEAPRGGGYSEREEDGGGYRRGDPAEYHGRAAPGREFDGDGPRPGRDAFEYEISF